MQLRLGDHLAEPQEEQASELHQQHDRHRTSPGCLNNSTTGFRVLISWAITYVISVSGTRHRGTGYCMSNLKRKRLLKPSQRTAAKTAPDHPTATAPAPIGYAPRIPNPGVAMSKPNKLPYFNQNEPIVNRVKTLGEAILPWTKISGWIIGIAAFLWHFFLSK